MTILKAIKLAMYAFWIFIIFTSFLSDYFATKIIKNINLILVKQKFYKTKITFNTFNETLSQKNILTRNIFNFSGKIPDEDNASLTNFFDIKNFLNVPCAPSSESFPVELIGIIFTNDPKTNLVVLRDSNAESADVYHEGDKILDYTNYSVYRVVNPTSVEFQYGTKKICRSLVSYRSDTIKKPENHTAQAAQISEDNSNQITLTHEYVNEELGKGLSKIVTTARIVPSMVNGEVEGFKMFSIAEGSLFSKIGLMNNDVIIEINNQKLSDPTKGFLIYDSFQYENQITFTIKRGTKSVIRKVIIK